MKVKQACRRDRPGGEPQGKGGAPTNRGQKESSVCFSSISIAKLSLCFELCKACAVFLRRCLLISIFPRAEPEYVCSPSDRGEGGELQWGEDGATKRDRCEKRGAVRRKRGTKQTILPQADSFLPHCFRTAAVVTCVASVPSRHHARLSPARALSRQPVSVFYLHSFTRMPHCVVIEGIEGEGLWYFKFTCVHRVRMRSEQSVGTRGGSYFLAYGAVSVHFIEVRR